ncbi:MAG: hypothetical protein ACYTXY_51085, partial [Nostoc sp.]
MDNNKIEVTGISKPLLRLIDERVRHFGGDRAAYIRDLIERDMFGTSHGHKHTFAFGTKRTFDSKQWKADMELLAQGAEQIP